MGAKYEPQWSDSSTHLICPIKGTPKYNEVKGINKEKFYTSVIIIIIYLIKNLKNII